METGNIVEFIDKQKIICAVIIEIKKLRLKLLTEYNRDVKLSANRLASNGKSKLDLGLGRVKTVAALKRIADRRKALIEKVDIQELWEVLNSEQEWIDLVTMTELCFPENPNEDYQSAVLRAFFNNRLYFKFNTDSFFPYSVEKVEQIKAQAKEADRQNLLIETAGNWVKMVLAAKEPVTFENDPEIIKILKSYYLHELDSPYNKQAQAILKKAGIKSKTAIFNLFVKLGIWDQNENIHLLRYDVPLLFSPKAIERANSLNSQISRPNFSEKRRDLSDLDIITIDGKFTLDFDDAISLKKQNENYILGIHIADVGHYIQKGDILDQEALERASSIYMPDQKISMVPEKLSENLCSLKQNELRPAISTMITITPTADIVDYEIFPSLIQVKKRLTFFDVNLILDENSTIAGLYMIAKNFREKRVKQGAVHINLPEVNVWLNNEQIPMLTQANRESPGRMLVSEIMIMANWLTADFLKKHQVPAVFRSQPGPRERLYNGVESSIFLNWMQRKHLSRFILGTTPERHCGLGLDAYTTATSPIRKYFDLVSQRQVRSVLGLEAPYSTREIKKIIRNLGIPMSQVSKIQFKRHRYWLLKYLENEIGKEKEAMVLNQYRDNFTILLKEYMMECRLSKSGNINLKPEELVQVKIQHASARDDLLSVFLC